MGGNVPSFVWFARLVTVFCSYMPVYLIPVIAVALEVADKTYPCYGASVEEDHFIEKLYVFRWDTESKMCSSVNFSDAWIVLECWVEVAAVITYVFFLS